MHTKSCLMLPLALSLAALQGCSTMEQQTPDKQASAQTAVSTPVAVAQPVSKAAVEPAPVISTNVDAGKQPVLVERYTVAPGDTLALIAAKQSVYGDARLWPLLYRANANQIGPRGLIFPNQVLVVDRKHTQEDVKTLIGRAKQPNAPTPLAAKAPQVAAPTANAPVVVPATTTPTAAAPVATTEKPVEAAPPAPTAAPPIAQTAAVAPAGNAPKGAPVAGQSVKLSDYLNGAREAFAAGDTPWAIYYYSVYLEQKKSDANVWGELGNVYYFDGDFSEAAKSYFNVANLLIDRGQTARALELIPVIEEGDEALAAAIYQRLTTVK